ncbi:MAG TPA: hypothetical protein VJQ58_07675 [Burkholderiales bacterium]|nr:hypothetical protein [Burkholderiales bacterium]
MRALLIVILLAGCSHSAVVVTNARPVAPSSTVSASAAFAAALLITTAAVAITQEASNPQPMPSSAFFRDWTSQPVPPMAQEREIREQDCTQPLYLSGNLRCR